MHAQLATLVVASSSSILPWQHPTCITSNMPRHTKHNHAPGDHPHAATSVFNEATRAGIERSTTDAHCASFLHIPERRLIVLGWPHGARIVLSFLQVACTNGEVVGAAVRAPSDLVSPRSWLLTVRVRGSVLAACLLRLVAHVGA